MAHKLNDVITCLVQKNASVVSDDTLLISPVYIGRSFIDNSVTFTNLSNGIKCCKCGKTLKNARTFGNHMKKCNNA